MIESQSQEATGGWVDFRAHPPDHMALFSAAAKGPTHHAGHGQALLVEHVAAVEGHHAEGLRGVYGGKAAER